MIYRATQSQSPRAKSLRGRRHNGAALVELALTLGILFSICYGSIECGYFFFVKNTMEGAAREGCRAGIVAGATDASVTSEVVTYMQQAGLVPNGTSASGSGGTFTVGNYTVVISPDITSGAATIGNNLQVTITATWGTVGSGMRPLGVISASKVISTVAVMRKEG
jgi:Flp pilus assembly protein TadG